MEETCKIEGCKREYKAKGYCAIHYKKWRHGELPKPRYKICGAENCRKPMEKKGLCKAHYETLVAEKMKATAPKQVAAPAVAEAPAAVPAAEPAKA